MPKPRLSLNNPPTPVGGIQATVLGAAVVFDVVAGEHETGQANFVKGDSLEYHPTGVGGCFKFNLPIARHLSWNTPNGSWGMFQVQPIRIASGHLR